MDRNRTHVGGNEVLGYLELSAGLRRMFLSRAFAVGALGLAILLPDRALAQQQVPAQRQAAPQVPTLHAVSLKRGNSISRTQSGGNEGRTNVVESSKKSSRSAAVKVTLRSFSKPTEPYEVQCFFAAKDSSRKRIIFDAKKTFSSEITDEISFFSKELDGGTEIKQTTTRKLADTPGLYGEPDRPGGDSKRSKVTAANGSKLEGWIVRVVSGGKVVRTEASLPELKRFAEQESAMLEGYAFSTPAMRR